MLLMVRSYVVAHLNSPSRQTGFTSNRAQAVKELAEAIALELEEWNDWNTFDYVNDWLFGCFHDYWLARWKSSQLENTTLAALVGTICTIAEFVLNWTRKKTVTKCCVFNITWAWNVASAARRKVSWSATDWRANLVLINHRLKSA